MKSIKLSPFALENIKSMSPAQERSVRETISKLQADGIHSPALEILRLPSKQGYVVKAKSGTRLTVVHEGGGHLLVDDVFVIRSPAAKEVTGATITAQKTVPSRARAEGRNVVKPTGSSSSTRGHGGAGSRKNTLTKKATAQKASVAKTA